MTPTETGEHGALAANHAAADSERGSVPSTTLKNKSAVTRPASTADYSLQGSAIVCREPPVLVVQVGLMRSSGVMV